MHSKFIVLPLSYYSPPQLQPMSKKVEYARATATAPKLSTAAKHLQQYIMSPFVRAALAKGENVYSVTFHGTTPTGKVSKKVKEWQGTAVDVAEATAKAAAWADGGMGEFIEAKVLKAGVAPAVVETPAVEEGARFAPVTTPGELAIRSQIAVAELGAMASGLARTAAERPEVVTDPAAEELAEANRVASILREAARCPKCDNENNEFCLYHMLQRWPQYRNASNSTVPNPLANEPEPEEAVVVEPDPAEPTIATEDPELSVTSIKPIAAANSIQLHGLGLSTTMPAPVLSGPITIFPGLPEHLRGAMPEAIQAVLNQRRVAEAEKGIAAAQAKLNSRRLNAIASKVQDRPGPKRALELMELELGKMKEALIELTELGVGYDAQYLGALARAGAPFPDDWNLYVQRLRAAHVLDEYGNFTDPEIKSVYMSKIAA